MTFFPVSADYSQKQPKRKQTKNKWELFRKQKRSLQHEVIAGVVIRRTKIINEGRLQIVLERAKLSGHEVLVSLDVTSDVSFRKQQLIEPRLARYLLCNTLVDVTTSVEDFRA